MDATMMVVASVPTPVKGAPQTGNASLGNGQDFSQILAGSLSQENQDSGKLASLVNLATGAGQLNQVLAQIVARLNSETPGADAKGAGPQDNTTDLDKLNFPQEILNALMILLQNLQTEALPSQYDEVAQNSPNGGLNNQSIQLLLEGLKSQEGIKGEIGAKLQGIISEATSLEDFSARLSGLLDQITAQAGKEPGKEGVVKKLSQFVAEIKELLIDTAKPDSVVKPTDVTPKDLPKEPDGQKVMATDAPGQKTVSQSKDNLNEPLPIDYRKSNLNNELRTEDQTNPYFNNNVKSVVNQDAPKVSSPANISHYGETIFNQIVEKAQIALGDGQSEMKIQLQPDFLGKVNMQIKIEEGVLTARFAAENMQVKQLIEANLNNLRQNLADQGFNVQQLQVTVGQQKDFDHYQKRQGHTGTTKIKSRPDLTGDLDAIEAVTTNSLSQEMAKRYGFAESDYDYVV